MKIVLVFDEQQNYSVVSVSKMAIFSGFVNRR